MASTINATTSSGIVATADNTGTLQLQTAGTNAINIDASQNVGIGASPTTKLQVDFSGAGTTLGSAPVLTLKNNSFTNNCVTGIVAQNSVGGNVAGIDFININQVTDGSGASGGIGFWQNTSGTKSYTMNMPFGGGVWVGGATTASGPVILQKGGAAGGSIITFFKPGSGATNVILNYYGTSTYVGGMNMDNTSTSFITSSDARLKKDIVESESASEKIDNIRVVSHGWKHDDSVVDYGLIAQELYEIMPRAVTKGDDNEEVETVWSVDYSKLVPMLIKAHQEQQTIINDLKARIEVLEAK